MDPSPDLSSSHIPLIVEDPMEGGRYGRSEPKTVAIMSNPDELYLDFVDHLEGGRFDQAEQSCEALSSLEPKSQRSVVAQAQLAEKRGDENRAVSLLESFTGSNLDAGVARANLARLYYKAGDRSKAVSTLRFALMRAPNQERSLHFFAALLQEDSGLQASLESLRLLAQMPGSWLPAWVAAQLAANQNSPEKISEFLLIAAKNSPTPFPPNPESFRELLMAVPPQERRAAANSLRPYCRSDVHGFLDLLLSATQPRYLSSPSPPTVHCLRRSTWRHLAQPESPSLLALGPICMLKPDSWGVAEIAHRLERGFALLACEALDSLASINAAVPLETIPSRGIFTRPGPLPGSLLAAQAGSSCTHLVSSYLSFREPSNFVLDVELYTSKGEYSGRDSFRALHPWGCLEALVHKLASLNSGPSEATKRPPMPKLDLADALARDAVASLTLCAEGALTLEALANPGLLLDQLVEYTVGNQSPASFLTLWAGVEAAARAGLEAGLTQRPVVLDLMKDDPELEAWVVGRES